MKKLYSTFVAALWTLGAAAANFNVSPQEAFTLSQPEGALELSDAPVGVMSANDVYSPMSVTIDTYIGNYDWHYISTATGKEEVGKAVITTGTLATEVKVTLTLQDGMEFYVKAGFNPLNNSIFIVKQYVGKNADGTGLYAMNVVRGENGKIVEGPMLTGMYNEATRTITIDGNLAVATTDVSWISFIVMKSTLVKTGGGIYEGFHEIGTGTFKDGIFGPKMNVAEADNPAYEVTIYEKNDLPGYYRIANPWSGPGLAALGDLQGYLDVNATDPDYVLVPLTNTHYVNGDKGTTCVISASSMYAKYTSPKLEKAQFIAEYPAQNITLNKTTNTVNFPPNCMFFIWPETDGYNFYGANFPYAGYLILPDLASVGSIATDAETGDAPVEYFNLQGMKVANPESGQIVIRRQGSDVKKVRVN